VLPVSSLASGSTRAAALSLLLLSAALLPAQKVGDFRDPDRNYDEGWVSLFNGKDPRGWVTIMQQEGGVKRYREEDFTRQSTFYIENGLLKTLGKPPGYVRTIEVYDNFAFHVEVRFPQKGNSGVLVYVQHDKVWPAAIECQLYDSHMGRIFPIEPAKIEGGEMIHAAARPTGEWNTYEVYSEEGRLATVVNGILVGLASNANPRMGYIALQSEGVPAEFRNIKIKRFTPAHHMRND
jgi:hypothetical protein